MLRSKGWNVGAGCARRVQRAIAGCGTRSTRPGAPSRMKRSARRADSSVRERGLRVLDTCASPCGKTTGIAAAMNGEGILVACDVRGRRTRSSVDGRGRAAPKHPRGAGRRQFGRFPSREPFDMRAGRRTLLRPGHASARPRHPVASAREDLRRSRRHSAGCCGHAAKGVAPGGRVVDATCRASRRKTSRSSNVPRSRPAFT